jgi:ubiquinone/menaquinone biosynthesis C-methylase UbiE
MPQLALIRIMGVYSRYIFPTLCDWVLDQPHMAKHRKEQLAGVGGEILEIGAGTGLNLPHYPPHVRRIVTVDPNPGMNKRLARRSQDTGIEVDRQTARGEKLPFEDNVFDCVVSTLTLCSIAAVEDALGEIFRVLKPHGRFVFFEHGLSPENAVANRQRRWTWIQSRLGDGCRLDLDVRQALASQPFQSIQVDNFYLENSPQTHGYIYRGAAVKGLRGDRAGV